MDSWNQGIPDVHAGPVQMKRLLGATHFKVAEEKKKTKKKKKKEEEEEEEEEDKHRLKICGPNSLTTL